MNTLTEILNNPEKHHPGNFDTPKRANALLMGLCQEAAAELRRLHEVNQKLLEALENVMYWDNGKPEWDDARAAIAKAQEQK